MKRSEREQLIERYLDGTMTSLEEQEFLIEVAANSELRTELKAYKVVESAVYKDRAADVVSYASLRTHMIGVLANASVGTVVSDASSAVSGAEPLPSAGSFGSVWARWLAAAGATALFVVGVIVVNPWAEPDVLPNAAPGIVSGEAHDTLGGAMPQQISMPLPAPSLKESLPQIEAGPVQDKSSRTTLSKQGASQEEMGQRTTPSAADQGNLSPDRGPASATADGRNTRAGDAKPKNGFNIDVQVDPPRNSR